MKRTMLSIILILIIFGCTAVEDNTVITIKGVLIDRELNPIQDIKIELVSSDINSSQELQNFGFNLSHIDRIDVFDVSNERGEFKFFFPRSSLNLALFIDQDQGLNFQSTELDENFPILIIEDSSSLDLNFEDLILIPSE
ncbi:hypothetical protein ES731_06345 [Psychroflexus gondwanensis]|jgi:hypothetical protein|uniref:Lipoprotein n=1 Tax=Psychroflexus gondwanensis ACAM 44 TaxID=1189619 RepID=N1X242_9FLAO|nr:hypothetical protein [Psychroflexus gondwanensis]EMY82128.1 hypothetical protein pgond44_02778 [Psychroflexus gondwanensis ACAM 44]TXE20129.1 hypothetical protein ES731_06345 [Psychroflexus gondwanensis]